MYEQIKQPLNACVLFIIPCVILLLLIYKFTKLPSYIFRKIAHIIAFSFVIIFIYNSINISSLLIASLLLTCIIYIALKIIKNKININKLLSSKNDNEIVVSFVLLMLMMDIVSIVGWFLFGHKEFSILSVLMWGVGDCFAAILGISFGKHSLRNKTYEGSISMFITSFIAGLIYLNLICHYEIGISILYCLPASIIATLTELYTPSEYDTITVPISVLFTIILINFFYII